MDPKTTSAHIDLTIQDKGRKRDIPVRVYSPSDKTPQPVILFSHGLGGSRDGSAFLGEFWARRGYLAIFLQHPGSDDSVWRNAPPGDRLETLKRAASVANVRLRLEDVHAVLNELEHWNSDQTNPLFRRMNLAAIGMSGHSFGALTTQAVSGESLALTGQKYTDARIKAALVLSPSTPAGQNAEKAFHSVNIPWLLMTGTKDLAPIGNVDLQSRLGVYPCLRNAAKYELVLNNAEHSVFTDRAFPGDRETRNPNHHRVILALSTAFWDAYLRENADALAWLNGDGPRSIMQAGDQWRLEVR